MKFLLVLLSLHPCAVQAQLYSVGLGGVSALSGAAAASASPVSASKYQPDPGLAVNAGVGYHWNNWISLQGNYIWNRNRVVSTEVSGASFRERMQTIQQTALCADVLVYFRPRTSHIRPYLSVGPAWVHLLSENQPGLRVAVGADLLARDGWGFRYSFSEMMNRNPIGAQLIPHAGGGLMNFQNLFGIVKTF